MEQHTTRIPTKTEVQSRVHSNGRVHRCDVSAVHDEIVCVDSKNTDPGRTPGSHGKIQKRERLSQHPRNPQDSLHVQKTIGRRGDLPLLPQRVRRDVPCTQKSTELFCDQDIRNNSRMRGFVSSVYTAPSHLVPRGTTFEPRTLFVLCLFEIVQIQGKTSDIRIRSRFRTYRSEYRNRTIIASWRT